MLIDRVDDSDQSVGTIEREQWFALRANFRTAHIFIFNHRNELMLQQIPESHPRHPGFWGSSVAAYLYAGEDYEHAARRRIDEELGVDGAVLDGVGKFAMPETGGVTKFIGLFRTTYEGPFRPNPEEVADMEWRAPNDIAALIQSGERRFTPTFQFLFDAYANVLTRSG